MCCGPVIFPLSVRFHLPRPGATGRFRKSILGAGEQLLIKMGSPDGYVQDADGRDHLAEFRSQQAAGRA